MLSFEWISVEIMVNIISLLCMHTVKLDLDS